MSLGKTAGGVGVKMAFAGGVDVKDTSTEWRVAVSRGGGVAVCCRETVEKYQAAPRLPQIARPAMNNATRRIIGLAFTVFWGNGTDVPLLNSFEVGKDVGSPPNALKISRKFRS